MTINNQTAKDSQAAPGVSDDLHRVNVEVEIRGEDDEKTDKEGPPPDQLRDGSE